MTNFVNRIKRIKYLVASSILIITLLVGVYLNQKRTDIYVNFDGHFSNCTNLKDYYKSAFYVVCDGDKTILFRKIKGKTSKLKSLEYLNKINVISKEELFEQFDDNLNFESNNYAKKNSLKRVNMFIIIKTESSKQIEIIPVSIIHDLSG